MGTFAILISISAGTQIGFWILSFINIFKHIDWSGGKKLLWVLIVLILGPLGTFLYLMFDQKKKWAIMFLILVIVPLVMAFMSSGKSLNPSEKINVYDNTADQIKNQSVSQIDRINLSQEDNQGDKMTITIITVLNRGLEKYYADNGSYPYPAGDKVLIGSDEFRYLTPLGFMPTTNGLIGDYIDDLRHPSADYNEAFKNIVYSSENNGQSYRIIFAIVMDGGQYSKGNHFATPQGIDQDDVQNSNDNSDSFSFVDSDNDGLSDQDEINLWHTDPNNPDTDGDGYLDGDEVKNGYNPLDEGEIK